MEAKLLAPHVDSHPDKRGGMPCVADTRLLVWEVHHCFDEQGKTVESVVASYPFLTPASVHAALAYYWDHAEEIEALMEADAARAESLIESLGPSLLETKRLDQEAG